MLPPLTIVMTTWMPDGSVGKSRRYSARAAYTSWRIHLNYSGELRLHLADDGSPVEDLKRAVVGDMRSWPITISRQQRRGVGASLNAGLYTSWTASPLAAYFVDDWGLQRPLDLTPWAKLLMEDETVGCVRLGPPHPGLTGEIEMFPQGWGLRLHPHHFAFSHRPALYHRRFFDAYGYFEEGLSALECERRYAEHFASGPCVGGPDIIYALSYPWVHLGKAEVGDITPIGGNRDGIRAVSGRVL